MYSVGSQGRGGWGEGGCGARAIGLTDKLKFIIADLWLATNVSRQPMRTKITLKIDSVVKIK